MLDSTTKRRIDTARDILVGKVPDPKSQVEQITIALIYKFMDDMDAESEELGGQRKFFSGDFARYGWAKLMRSGLGGHETLNLYAEAIARMPENPGIPALFRDIFKNAFLPYRDPETLRAFLKVIDEFEYDHSERLGDAFEYLLSVLGSQGSAGQFRTPRHIIDFMVQIVDPKKDETVLDPACGTAGFLISAYKHILRANSTPEAVDPNGGDNGAETALHTSKIPAARGDLLTPDERGKLANNFCGYDISPDMVRLSLVNMYLHGFADPHIYEYDTLTSQERWNEHADVILANPPFMSPKGGIRPHNKFSVQSKRSEVLFVDYMAEHLTPTGRAGIIVPEGIIFQSQNAYKQLRKMLVDEYLVAVISLPAGVFQPYSGVKTSILILDKALAKKADTIGFFKVENDGFDLGAQRRPINGNDLPQIRAEIRSFLVWLRNEQPKEEFQSSMGHAVERARITANGDCNLSGERYRASGRVVSQFPYRSVGEISDINLGSVDPREIYDSWFRYIDISCIGNSSGRFLGATRLSTDEAPSRARRPVTHGDILLSTVRPNLRAFAYLEEVPERAVASTGFAVLRAKQGQVLPGFLIAVLRDERAVNQMVSMMGRGSYPSINQTDVASITVPVPPLEVQKEIVAEIEGYQKVIDGARVVVENYRPMIPINPEWPIARIGDVCTLVSGQHIASGDYNREGIGTPYLTGPADFGFEHPLVTKWTTKPKVFAQRGDILITVKGSGIGKVNLLNEEQVAISRQLMAIRANQAVPRFVYFFLRQKYEHLNNLGDGAAIPGITREQILSLALPLPDVGVQEEIVAEIEMDRSAVATNLTLIKRLERRIQATLARVWGDEETQATEETEE